MPYTRSSFHLCISKAGPLPCNSVWTRRGHLGLRDHHTHQVWTCLQIVVWLLPKDLKAHFFTHCKNANGKFWSTGNQTCQLNRNRHYIAKSSTVQKSVRGRYKYLNTWHSLKDFLKSKVLFQELHKLQRQIIKDFQVLSR